MSSSPSRRTYLVLSQEERREVMTDLIGVGVGGAVRFRCASVLCQRRNQGSVLVEIERGMTLIDAGELNETGSLPIIAECSCCGGIIPLLTQPLTGGFSWDE